MEVSVGSPDGVTPLSPALSEPCSLQGPLTRKWDWIPSPCSGADLSLKHHCLGSEGSQLGTPAPIPQFRRHYLVPAFGSKHLAPCRPYPLQACSPGFSDLPALLTAPQGLCTDGTKFGCKDGGGSQAGAVEQRREGAGIAGQWPQG